MDGVLGRILENSRVVLDSAPILQRATKKETHELHKPFHPCLLASVLAVPFILDVTPPSLPPRYE